MEDFAQYPVTVAIIVLNAIISWQGFNNRAIIEKLVFHPYTIKREKQYFRFITSGFIHADMSHLAFNMLTLYFFGSVMEPVFVALFGNMGHLVFLLFYLSAIGVAGLYSYYKNQDNSQYSALGASGAVSAVLYSFILIQPWGCLALFFAIPVPAIILAIAYLWYSSYMGKKGTDNVGHDAHFYGAIFGLIFPIILKPKLIMLFLNELAQFDILICYQ